MGTKVRALLEYMGLAQVAFQLVCSNVSRFSMKNKKQKETINEVNKKQYLKKKPGDRDDDFGQIGRRCRWRTNKTNKQKKH